MSTLLIIDPQNDFCHPNGALYVKGAQEDCICLANFIQNNKDSFQSMFVTIDSHPYYHISHPAYWVTDNGSTPKTYTQITYDDFLRGKIRPKDESLNNYINFYLESLQVRGRYTLTLWPPHCLIGSEGMAIEKNIWDAVQSWQVSEYGHNITFVNKSTNANTEHYSCVQAEVPDDRDPTTCTNYDFINKLKDQNEIFIAGEALSHCVANTIRDLSVHIPLSKMTLLTDCTSPIPGFEHEAETFINEMCARGMHTAISTAVRVYAHR